LIDIPNIKYPNKIFIKFKKYKNILMDCLYLKQKSEKRRANGSQRVSA